MTADVAGAIWTPGRFRLFLSHISQEKTFVSAVKAELAAYEVDGFVAHEDIEPTADWQDAIEQASPSATRWPRSYTPDFTRAVGPTRR